jgi:hypothetical protein
MPHVILCLFKLLSGALRGAFADNPKLEGIFSPAECMRMMWAPPDGRMMLVFFLKTCRGGESLHRSQGTDSSAGGDLSKEVFTNESAVFAFVFGNPAYGAVCHGTI